MIRHIEQCTKEYRERMRDGDGTVEITNLSDKEELYDKARLYAKIVLNPGCGIGFHMHEGEEELYHILKGNAIYNDNGVEVPVSAGDTTVCPSGTGHGIKNTGAEVVEMIALIVMK